jgi:hypothetical protein
MGRHENQAAISRFDPMALVQAFGNQQTQMGPAPGPGISCRCVDYSREQTRYPFTHCRFISGVAEERHNSRLSL